MADERAQVRKRHGLATVEEAIDEIRAGRFVIIVDDEDRENEGDLVMAAEFVHAPTRSTSWPSTAAA